MLHKQLTHDGIVVTFVLDESSHHCPVSVAGDFNGWDVAADPLVPDGHGLLVASISLPVERTVEFRYRDALGRWFNDDTADDYCTNEWGGMNGVLHT